MGLEWQRTEQLLQHLRELNFPCFPSCFSQLFFLSVANWVLQGRTLEIKIIQIHKFAKSGKAGKHKEHISIEQPIFSSKKKKKGYKNPTTYQALLYFNNFCF